MRVHDEHRWLGYCREFTRILPAEKTLPPLVLRALDPADELRALLAKGTRKALDLKEIVLEVRDDQQDLPADCELWAKAEAWHPSPHGPHLIDLRLGRHYPSYPSTHSPSGRSGSPGLQRHRPPGPALVPGNAGYGWTSSGNGPARVMVIGRRATTTNSTAGTSPTNPACTWRSARP
ncbi:hypothetical protein ACU686_33595 [Yinghuangia aomiensis]